MPVPFASAAKAAGAALAARDRSVHTTGRKLESALKRAGVCTVVVIDEIDRLTADEIRDALRLIKSVARLSGATHVVDVERTVVVLREPSRPPACLKHLQPILADMPAELWSGRECQNLIAHALIRLLRTLRAVVRLPNAPAATYPPVRDDVYGVDFLGTEALRLFAPVIQDVAREHRASSLPTRHRAISSSGEASIDT